MARIRRWLKISGITLVVTVALGGAILYFGTELMLRRHYDVPLSSFAASTDASSAARGRHLATILGCYKQCHGVSMKGFEIGAPYIGHINAPNLTRVVHEYSDPELERLLRRGIKRDGTSVLLMPSQMFAHLSDTDLGAVIAFVRSAPPIEGGVMRGRTLWPLARLGILSGRFQTAADLVDRTASAPAEVDLSDRMELGRYLAAIACTECHGEDLRGVAGGTPSLAIAAAYDDPAFAKLLRTGVPLGDRVLGLMKETSVGRFVDFGDDEIAALRAYLASLAAPPPTG